MSKLLGEQNEEYFQSDFPIIYKNKIKKSGGNYDSYYYRSAIDSSLKNNQVKAVGLMIEYIVKYQNSYVSSYLFKKNLTTLLEKGI